MRLSLIFLEPCYFPIVYFCHPAAMKEMHVFCDNGMKSKFKMQIKTQSKPACHFRHQLIKEWESFMFVFISDKKLHIFSDMIPVRRLNLFFLSGFSVTFYFPESLHIFFFF